MAVAPRVSGFFFSNAILHNNAPAAVVSPVAFARNIFTRFDTILSLLLYVSRETRRIFEFDYYNGEIGKSETRNGIIAEYRPRASEYKITPTAQ